MKQWWSISIIIASFLVMLSSCARVPEPTTPAPTVSTPTETQPPIPATAPLHVPEPTLAPRTTLAPVQPTPTIKTMPAEFNVTSLTVTPVVASPGQAVTAEVKIKNVGGTEGSYRLSLTINRVEEEVRDIRIAPGNTETITFTLSRDASGMYEIGVAGLIDTLKVKQPGAYPKLSNYYHIITSIDRSQAALLAKWDLIVVHSRVLNSSQDTIRLIRKLNPSIKILVFISAGLYESWWSRDKMMSQHFNENWILHYGDTPSNPKPPEERRVISWTDKTGTNKVFGMNPSSEWSTYLPQFVQERLMSSGLFDGVFYDCLWEKVWRTNIDINNDGVADSQDVVNREYQKGMVQILKSTRELLGPNAIIFGNPGVEWSSDSPYWAYANGHMQENALGTMFGSSWPRIWDIYQRNMQKPPPPSRIHLIAVDTNQKEYNSINPDLPPADLQKMRLGLAITLLGDGYFGFDEGDGLHGQLWWFPEYDADLGLAKGDAQRRSDGTWVREFQNGLVVANPTSKGITIEFASSYRDVTTGIEASHFVVSPNDGRIFVVVH